MSTTTAATLDTLRALAEDFLCEFFPNLGEFRGASIFHPGELTANFTLSGEGVPEVIHECRFAFDASGLLRAFLWEGKVSVLTEFKIPVATDESAQECVKRLFAFSTRHLYTPGVTTVIAGDGGRRRASVAYLDDKGASHGFTAVFDDKGVLEYHEHDEVVFHAIHDEASLDRAGYREFILAGHEDTMRDIIRDFADFDRRSYRIEYFRDPEDGDEDDDSVESVWSVDFDRFGVVKV